MSYAYITEEGAYIKKRGGRFVVGREKETVMEIPEDVLESVVLMDGVQVSSQAMTEFLRLGIPVTWISHIGKFQGRLISPAHVNVFRQVKQIELQGSPFFLKLAKKTIAAKTHNQLTVLRRYNRRANDKNVEKSIRSILALWKNIFQSKDSSELMGNEGIIARIYFEAVGRMVEAPFSFEKRTKQPPKDAFNSMLSFGYTLLMYELYTAISLQGLHPYFGFLHSLKEHHPALASDLLEEWRAAIVDSLVLSVVHHHEILSEHFEKDKETEGVYLTRVGRNIFLRAYEKKMRAVNRYMNGSHSYRYCLYYQSKQFAQALMAENEGIYEPLYLR